MKCECGAGYCADNNVTYPCVCDIKILNEFKEDKEMSSYLVNFFEPGDQEYFEEEDDLPF